MRLSIIIPVLNEAALIQASLQRLQGLRAGGHEIIVVDGGSQDNTPELARGLADQVIASPAGRGLQLHRGAQAAGGDILLFLHVDTELPERAAELIDDGLIQSRRQWGRFDASLSGRAWLLRLVASLMNWRSRWSGIATGDQAMFMWRRVYFEAGGFPPIPLMEDIALSRRLKTYSRPLCLRAKVITSSRRWEKHGIIRTILRMWRLRLEFFLGADPHRLQRRYEAGE
jgi:rSAM/selenodomain-associated transferase 2